MHAGGLICEDKCGHVSKIHNIACGEDEDCVRADSLCCELPVHAGHSCHALVAQPRGREPSVVP